MSLMSRILVTSKQPPIWGRRQAMISMTRLLTRLKISQRREPTRQPTSARRAITSALIETETTARMEPKAPKMSCERLVKGCSNRGSNALTFKRQAKSLAMATASRTPPTRVHRILSNGREARTLTSAMTSLTATLSLTIMGPIFSTVASSPLMQPIQRSDTALGQ